MSVSPPPSPPDAEGYVFPASFAQRRLWFLHQFEPDSAFYNIPAPIRLQGALDVAALRAALSALIRRHESLRTTFGIQDGVPVQVIAASPVFDLPVSDLSALPEEAREAGAQQLVLLESQKPFDLRRGPLLRAQLLKLGEADHLLLMTLHHIIADGWSVRLLFRELDELYAAYAAGREIVLPELPVQYADFACWQQQWLSGSVYDSLLGYWREQLEGAPPLLELPADRPRPPVQVFRGGQHNFMLPAPLVAALKALAEEEQSTLFMTMLAAFKALLYRYTRAEDVIVGTPIANRTRPELEGIIGFFANTLVLRTRMSGDLSFRQLIRRVREVTLGAYAHQDMPFEKLVEELSPRRSLSYNPLFQVLFLFDQMDRGADGAGQQPHEGNHTPAIDTGTAKFDLTLFLAETSQGMHACLEYYAELFDSETIARMGKHFEILLRAAAADPDRPVESLPMLSHSELLTLASWNETDAPFEARCVHELFEAQTRRTPDATAVSFGGLALSYGELNARANFWAHRLRESGVVPETRVGIYMERSVEMIVAVLAVLKAGGAYVPLDPDYPRERLQLMLEDGCVEHLLTQQHLRDVIPSGHLRASVLDVVDSEAVCEKNPALTVTPGNLAYIIYTSGSTGRPKGVAMPHRPLSHLMEWQVARSALPPGARTLQFASLNFDVSFQEIFSTLCAGGALVLISEEQRRDPRAVWEVLRAAQINRLFLPYVALQQLAEQAREIVSLPASLREVITAGEQLYITPQIGQLMARLDCPLYNQYGPSESHVVTELKLSGPPSGWAARPAIGRPIANARIHLLDASGEPVPVGVPGEIYIGGVALARGYLGRPGFTAQRFVPDPDVDGRLYRTGDRGSYLPDGNIEFLGRFDDQLKIRGFRVEPGEIEVTLCGHPALREAAVCARQVGSGGPQLVAYVEQHAGASVTAQELRAHLASSLPEYMLPAAFVFLDSMPLTPSGKLNRRALPEPGGASTAAAAAFVAPRTPVEESLAKIWCELLGLERVGVYDNFFDLGGHSLLATQLVSHIREELHAELQVRTVFESPTIESLAMCVVQTSFEEEGEEEAARLLAELEGLSDEEARALLGGESPGGG
ncbi:MAG: amino acid adenylation domain-containing protein [Pyrinomonadaceae bacterium]